MSLKIHNENSFCVCHANADDELMLFKNHVISHRASGVILIWKSDPMMNMCTKMISISNADPLAYIIIERDRFMMKSNLD